MDYPPFEIVVFTLVGKNSGWPTGCHFPTKPGASPANFELEARASEAVIRFRLNRTIERSQEGRLTFAPLAKWWFCRGIFVIFDNSIFLPCAKDLGMIRRNDQDQKFIHQTQWFEMGSRVPLLQDLRCRSRTPEPRVKILESVYHRIPPEPLYSCTKAASHLRRQEMVLECAFFHSLSPSP